MKEILTAPNKAENNRGKEITEANGGEFVETESGRFHLLYNIHGGLGVSRPLKPELMKNKDALIFEGMGISEKFLDRGLTRGMLENYMKTRNVNQELIRQAVMDCTPVFLIDVSEKLKEIYKNEEIHIKIKAFLEVLVGGGVVFASKKFFLKDDINRREFLKRFGTLAAAGYLSTPILTEMTAPMIKNKAVKNFKKVSDYVHPELDSFIVEGRNSLYAQKAEEVARQRKAELGHDPDVAISIGAAHYGLADALRQDDEKRLDKIKSYKDVNPAEEALIIRIDFEKMENNGRNFRVSLSYDETMRNAGAPKSEMPKAE